MRANLTMEVWYKPQSHPDNRDWILGHDDGGYDRAIMTYDNRFGGLAMGIGSSYSSTLGYPTLDEWIHIVATYSSDGVATLYTNGGYLRGGNQQNKSITGDSGSSYKYIGLNGVPKYTNHHVIGCFAQVQLTNRVLSAEEVADLFDEFDDKINTGSVLFKLSLFFMIISL